MEGQVLGRRLEELDFFWPGKEEAERGRVTSYKYSRNVNTVEAEEPRGSAATGLLVWEQVRTNS